MNIASIFGCALFILTMAFSNPVAALAQQVPSCSQSARLGPAQTGDIVLYGHAISGLERFDFRLSYGTVLDESPEAVVVNGFEPVDGVRPMAVVSIFGSMDPEARTVSYERIETFVQGYSQGFWDDGRPRGLMRISMETENQTLLANSARMVDPSRFRFANELSASTIENPELAASANPNALRELAVESVVQQILDGRPLVSRFDGVGGASVQVTMATDEITHTDNVSQLQELARSLIAPFRQYQCTPFQ